MTVKCLECQRRFAPARRDAVYCSERCRVAAWRHRGNPEAIQDAEAPAPVEPSVEPISDSVSVLPLLAELEDGWRRVGPYIIPPADPRHTFYVDPDDALRRPRP